jgi:pyruvate, orthophosphate dikinase
VGYAFAFDHAHDRPPRDLKDLLGGKGANLAEMTSVLDLPVPPGFTISTEACQAYLAGDWPDGLDEEIAGQVGRLEEAMGRGLGDPDDPLLVSVRSGAKFSMPGMMDTILNLGLTDESLEGLARGTDRRFALDSYRRVIEMYGTTVRDVDGERFTEHWEEGLDADGLAQVVDRYKAVYEDATGEPFPQDPQAQLRGAVEAVFRSWNTPRAAAYRRREHIPDDLGTAVNVQVMVFGNRDDRSGTGVGFTRDPATGDAGLYGDFLVNAQGEDVVAGVRNTLPLTDIGEHFPDLHGPLLEIFDRLEQHYRDMMDIEFTIEQDRLWILQTRVGKRTGAAAIRLAVAMSEDERIALTPAEAVERVLPEHIDQVLHPQLEEHEGEALTTGLGASPGAAVGKVYFTADDVVDAVRNGEKAVLVRRETSPDDVHGMEAAEGVLTARGGLVSHAAVVARQWGKPAVVGAEEIEVSEHSFSVGDVTVEEGDVISIDGATGEVVLGEVGLVEGRVPPELATVLGWADEIRAGKLGVRANADTAADATLAREWGAEGLGLCRTEHQFLGERLPTIRRMILADDEDEEAAALEELGDQQRADFEVLLEAMDGLPVTVRLLDPPLHEFLPDLDDLIAAEATGTLSEEDAALLGAARQWREQNPMLGVRGVRLAVLHEGLYKTQVRALLGAADARCAAGGTPIVEIMIPLVVVREELALARSWVEEELAARSGGAEVRVGTMIETPRAALRAHEIAEVADFFSFGTNDLTQLTFGFSRDDVEGRMLTAYLERGLLAADPFEILDLGGVADLIRLAIAGGRRTRPDLKVGVCGEHGGEPTSIAAFYALGVDYVSCSPYRVPIARLAAARAVLDGRDPTAPD